MASSIITELMEKARAAQKVAAGYAQQQIDDLCLSVGWQVYRDDNIKQLAELAAGETGMGNAGDKILKHKGKVMGVLSDLQGAKSVGLIDIDQSKGLYKYAKPVGVVGALCPVTNPTATPSSNGLSILKGGNAVIFAPHPRAKQATALAVQFMREGLRQVGAPEDLVQVVAEPSIETTGELMAAVDLVLATGGGAMVKAAYSSGTPAYGVGPGNACQIIAEDADIADAASKIFLSKTFDNATSCSSENSIIIHRDVYDALVDALVQKGSVLAVGAQRDALEKALWKPNKHGKLSLDVGLVCKSAGVIAQAAGIEVPADTKMLMVEGDLGIEGDLFAGEKMTPVLTLYRYQDFDEALDILIRLTDHAGTGHSSGIHTFSQDYIDKLGCTMRSSRILVRQPQAQGNGGNFFNGLPSTVTLGCGTWGGNITTENIHYKHFLNVTWLSLPIERKKPTDDEMWGAFWQRHGK